MKISIHLAVFCVALGAAELARGADTMLPDPKLTPGKVARSASDRHSVSEAMEQKVFARYGIPWSRRAEFRIDHLIPEELGGADTIDNLWPQNLTIKPYDARRKDFLTQRMLALIATRQITRAQAQKEICKDWIDAFIDHVGLVYLR